MQLSPTDGKYHDGKFQYPKFQNKLVWSRTIICSTNRKLYQAHRGMSLSIIRARISANMSSIQVTCSSRTAPAS